MPVRVPLLDLVAQYETIRSELDAAVARVAASQQFVMGQDVLGIEDEVAAYCGAKHAIGVSSGSEALLLAYMGLGIEPGDEVVCPTYTFFSTAGSVSRLGAIPVFADIDPTTYNVTPETLARALHGRSRVKVIVPVHLFGQSVDMAPIEELAAQHGVQVIEDAAQAIGSVDGAGRRVGSGVNLTCLSFFPSKNLGAWGDGGMLLGGDDDLVERIKVLRVHGGKPKYHHGVIGLNARLDALQAAVLRAKLPHLDDWHEARARNASIYDAAFLGAGALPSEAPLSEGGLALRTPLPPKAPARHIYNQYVIRVPADRRDGLRAFLTERGIGNEVYYPVPLHLQACYADLGGKPGDLPEAEKAAAETVALPIYPELSDDQRDAVAGSVLDFLSR